MHKRYLKILILSPFLFMYFIVGCATMTPLTKAAKEGNIQTMQTAIKSGANVNEPSTGKSSASPIIWALWSGLSDQKIIEMIQLLIDNGANINMRDTSGYTPLHWSVFQGKPEVAKYLIMKGADPTARDTYGQTPLGLAISYNYSDFIPILKQFKGVPIKIGIITDACISRDTMSDDPYLSIEDSIYVQKQTAIAAKSYLEKMGGYDVSIYEIPFVCTFGKEKSKVAKREDAPISIQSPPYYINETSTTDTAEHQTISNIIREAAQSGYVINEKYLNEIRKQKNIDRVLILATGGMIVPKVKSAVQGVAIGAVTTALTLGMFTYTRYPVSALMTNVTLIDLQTGKVLFSKKSFVKGGGFTESKYYESGLFYDNCLQPIGVAQ